MGKLGFFLMQTCAEACILFGTTENNSKGSSCTETCSQNIGRLHQGKYLSNELIFKHCIFQTRHMRKSCTNKKYNKYLSLELLGTPVLNYTTLLPSYTHR